MHSVTQNLGQFLSATDYVRCVYVFSVCGGGRLINDIMPTVNILACGMWKKFSQNGMSNFVDTTVIPTYL